MPWIWLYLPWAPEQRARSGRARRRCSLEYSGTKGNPPARVEWASNGSNDQITAWGLAIFTRNDKRVARSAPAETEN